MYQEEEAQGEEEQENEFSQNKLNNQPAKKASVVISSGSLFDEEGRTFTFRKPGTSTENTIPKTKDWHQIAYDFLSNPSESLDISTNDSFQSIDVSRASEFVAGQGATNWGEVRRQTLESSKEKRRRAKK